MNHNIPGNIPVLGICAAGSNAGKTTLITQLIPVLAQHGVRVSVIKHAHHKFDIDHPGKDSYHIREAGAVQTLIASSKRWALMTEMQRTPQANEEANLTELIAQLTPDYADLILVEGFKQADIAKIEVHRPSLNMPLLAENDRRIIAIATDAPLALPQLNRALAMLDLNNIAAIADFILLHHLPK
ncbi:MAG TPA: molybdopterin-guanine dinucleotide biosynthesis protein B [Methylophilus sp.]